MRSRIIWKKRDKKSPPREKGRENIYFVGWLRCFLPGGVFLFWRVEDRSISAKDLFCLRCTMERIQAQIKYYFSIRIYKTSVSQHENRCFFHDLCLADNLFDMYDIFEMKEYILVGIADLESICSKISLISYLSQDNICIFSFSREFWIRLWNINSHSQWPTWLIPKKYRYDAYQA